jgi:hypothetical protein
MTVKPIPKKECNMMMSENTVLTEENIWTEQRKEVTGTRSELSNEELYNLYPSVNITGKVIEKGEMIGAYRYFVGKSEGW